MYGANKSQSCDTTHKKIYKLSQKNQIDRWMTFLIPEGK